MIHCLIRAASFVAYTRALNKVSIGLLYAIGAFRGGFVSLTRDIHVPHEKRINVRIKQDGHA
jgi:hypothetical protein